MLTSKKSLILLFSIFCIVIVLEIGFYIIFSRPKKTFLIDKIAPSSTPSSTPQSDFSYSGKTMFPVDQEPGIAPFLTSYLASLPKGVLESSTLKNQFTGIISTLDTEGGILPFTKNFPYRVALSIKGRESGANTFWYNDSNLKNMKVFTNAGGKETPLSISNLKEGDAVEITETIDLTKDFDDNRTEIRINKL